MPGELPLVDDGRTTVAREDKAILELLLAGNELELHAEAIANGLHKQKCSANAQRHSYHTTHLDDIRE